MSNEQKLREAFSRIRARLMLDVIDSHTISLVIADCDQALATTEPEPTGMQELHPVAHIELGDDSHDVVTLEAAKAYGGQCWRAGYKHGAWGGDARDAERYRWLRDDTDSDWAICEWSHDPGDEGYYRDARAPHIVDAAIDAAMAKGVKG